MLMFGDEEAQYSLFHTNVWATRLRWPSVPLLVGEGRLMGKVGGYPAVEQPEDWTRECQGLNSVNKILLGTCIHNEKN